MNKRERAQVVELLRCTADRCQVDRYAGIYGTWTDLGYRYGSAVDYGVCLLCGRHTGRIDTPAITRTPAVELGEEES